MERTNRRLISRRIFIGIILIGLATSGFYLVKNYNAQRPSPAAQPPDQSINQTPVESEQAAMSNGNVIDLPATGLQDTAGSLLLFGLFTLVVVEYLQSRRFQLSL